MSANPARKLARAAAKRATEGKITLPPPPEQAADEKQKFERRTVLCTTEQVDLIRATEARVTAAQNQLQAQAAMVLAQAGITEGRIVGLSGRKLLVDVPVRGRRRKR